VCSTTFVVATNTYGHNCDPANKRRADPCRPIVLRGKRFAGLSERLSKPATRLFDRARWTEYAYASRPISQLSRIRANRRSRRGLAGDGGRIRISHAASSSTKLEAIRLHHGSSPWNSPVGRSPIATLVGASEFAPKSAASQLHHELARQLLVEAQEPLLSPPDASDQRPQLS